MDTDTGRLGEVMGSEGGTLQLRPPGGGLEWDCRPEAARPASPGEELSAKVAHANHRPRRW
ncbi:hypothetical protein [Streptomyces sp. GC420]|uniref:hypothetical protein n=1 Tax=Streptomyces sp. GC420 TaxID=2697568 RepID=UPI0014151B0A|nr:hypothetical protein [Streptomyces sp. GC420]NBM18583.1 hypothetical protein [Streptomyces sp. GC420]